MLDYLLFRARHNRFRLRDNIRSAIYHAGLSRQVECLKFEGGKSREYYLGIGVNLDDLDQNTLSKKLEDFLTLIDQMGYKLIPLRDMGGSCFFSEIQISGGFLKENFEYDSFLEPIRFEPIAAAPEAGLSADDVLESESDATVCDEASMDRLLWWMSAKGESSMQVFRGAVSILFLDDGAIQGGAWAIMRKLILLGHVEVDEDGRWGMVPTTMVRTASAGAFLAGKVTPRVISLLDAHEKSLTNGGPSRIGLSADADMDGSAVIDDPASAIAGVLPDFRTWLDGLRGEPDIEPHRYSLKLYDGRCFNDYHEDSVRSGFYEVERHEGTIRPKRVLFDGRRWMGGAYYDLRWAAKKIGGSNMEIWIDADGALLIPEAERWPMLYERPLVLSSGKLPELKRVGSHMVLAYDAVGKDVALMLAGKLGLKLMEDMSL
uniref:Uncharacterized protein n=1 Tax=Chlorobium phaeovibrioides (strain DSM 265 / 1930) TaxID=290318 RepID=A4SC90_CHLPM